MRHFPYSAIAPSGSNTLASTFCHTLVRLPLSPLLLSHEPSVPYGGTRNDRDHANVVLRSSGDA